MTVKLSKNAVQAVAAKDAPTKEELAYRDLLEKCVPCEAHIQKPSNVQRLYTVTTLAASPKYGGERTPVICTSFERAVQIVARNEGDIWETSYHLVVIEATQPNVLYGGFLDEQYWYKWDPNAQAYRPIQCPPGKENILGYGIG